MPAAALTVLPAPEHDADARADARAERSPEPAADVLTVGRANPRAVTPCQPGADAAADALTAARAAARAARRANLDSGI